MRVTVFTLPSCTQCDRTKKLLDREGIEYEVVDLMDDPALADDFKSRGLMQAPIVLVEDGQEWAGFRPDLIMGLKAEA